MAVEDLAVQGKSGPALEITGLTKTFAGTRALQDASLSVHRGEILALLGENGAGKSTLIKILAGVYQADSGTIMLGGVPLAGQVRTRPISFIHQDLGLVDDLSVAENIALVNGFPRQRRLISWRQVRAVAKQVLAVLDAPIDVERPVRGLTATERSIVGIARAVSVHAEVLVLDEPTAALPAGDVEKLFGILRKLRGAGVALIYVTHRIDEVFRLADRVTVLRNGRVVASEPIAAISPEMLIAQILGRPVTDLFVEPPEPGREVVLEVEGVAAGTAGPVSFRVNAGEVVGLVGRIGAGHDAIGRAIYGALPRAGGMVRVTGRQARQGVAAARRIGIEFCTGRRVEEGIATQLSVRENLWMNPGSYGRKLLAFRSRAAERRQAGQVLYRYDVRLDDTEQAINTLSGGNQQKVVLARAMETKPRLLIVEEPTAGVDVGAKAQIYRIIEDALGRGLAVLMISSDFEEIAETCFRALVFERGRIVAELRKPNVSQEQLTRIASGDHRKESNRAGLS